MKLSEFVACVRGDPASKLVTAEPSASLADIAMLMRKENVGAVIIATDKQPVGLVTDRDLALSLGADGLETDTPVERVMSHPVRTIPEGAGVFAATQCMMDAGVRRLPIVNINGAVTGLVSLDDLIRLLGRELHNLSEGVRNEMESPAKPQRDKAESKRRVPDFWWVGQ